ncbi:hypothetical protein LCGC14_1681550 [marine sediment metagenome]|uniref:Uncharacterized protein n=1 Tax=marine sediment metagenome TaxID=412755 RepID=A0A0F9K3Y9_9ZZZZ
MGKNGNKWISNNLKIVLLIASLIAIGAVMREAIRKDIPALYAADKEQCEAINANENAIIEIEGKIENAITKMDGKMETIQVRQSAYHKDSSKQLEEILIAIKANKSP